MPFGKQNKESALHTWKERQKTQKGRKCLKAFNYQITSKPEKASVNVFDNDAETTQRDESTIEDAEGKTAERIAIEISNLNGWGRLENKNIGIDMKVGAKITQQKGC